MIDQILLYDAAPLELDISIPSLKVKGDHFDLEEQAIVNAYQLIEPYGNIVCGLLTTDGRTPAYGSFRLKRDEMCVVSVESTNYHGKENSIERLVKMVKILQIANPSIQIEDQVGYLAHR